MGVSLKSGAVIHCFISPLCNGRLRKSHEGEFENTSLRCGCEDSRKRRGGGGLVSVGVVEDEIIEFIRFF